MSTGGTTAGFPVTLGTTQPVATPTTNSFSNTGLASSTTYYHKVSAVDNAGNIGALSVEISGTTLPLGTVFYDVSPPGNSADTLKGGGIIRSGEEPSDASSLIGGKSFKSIKVRLRKKGNPSGPVNIRIRRKTDDFILSSFSETIQSNTLGTSFADYVFTLSTAYTLNGGERILVEHSGQNGVDVEISTTDKFDGSSTRKVSFATSYFTASSADIVGTMSS